MSAVTKEVVLNTFSPSMIGPNKVVAFIGKRKSGKSFLMEDICYHLRSIPEAIIWSSTEEGNETWGRHFPGLYIHTIYNPDTLRAVYERQKQKAAKRRREGKQGVPDAQRTRVTPVLLILEDQSFNKSIFRCPVLAEVLMNGRHYGMTLFITTQYSRSITVELRSQFDFVFCCLEKFVQNRKRLYEDYFGVFPTFDSFNQIMMQCTSDFGCLVMNNISRSCDIDKSVYYYKAKDWGDYKFGSRAYWLFHYMNYKDEDEEESAPDPFEQLKPKSRTKITVGIRGCK